MVKRIVTKIGNIFCAEIDGQYKCYFQYIANDMTELNSSVIRVFKTHYPMEYVPVFDDIVKDEVYFYAHTILRYGIMYNAWYKVGKHADVGNTEDIWFRFHESVGPVSKSYQWFIWKINQEMIFIGEMKDEYAHYDLGVVFSYDNIVNKIAKGEFLLRHVD